MMPSHLHQQPLRINLNAELCNTELEPITKVNNMSKTLIEILKKPKFCGHVVQLRHIGAKRYA